MMTWQFDLNRFLKNPIVWKVFYHFVIAGAVVQYIWMVIWLLVKSNYTWYNIWWLVAILIVAQVLFGSGLISILVFSQLAHRRNVLIPVTRFWRLPPVAPVIQKEGQQGEQMQSNFQGLNIPNIAVETASVNEDSKV